MSKIIQLLKKAKEEYYKGNPIISDSLYDSLASRFGYEEFGEGEFTNKVIHLFPMYSLEKFYKEDNNSPKFSKSVKTPKLDGSAIELIYVQGQLASASTRGDGISGENITDKFTNGKLVPNIIYNYHFSTMQIVQVVGEIVAPKTIENSRNYAAGALHLKDINEFDTRDLTFIAYGMKPYATSNYLEDMKILTECGFFTVIDSDWKEFPQDGVVYRCLNNNDFVDYGYTAKHPKGAYALKKRSDVAVEETTLIDVVWQIGKGGKVTPVAIFQDIVIDGATINRATLHNAGFIENLDLHLGDTLLVTRSGGIIPKVIGKV